MRRSLLIARPSGLEGDERLARAGRVAIIVTISTVFFFSCAGRRATVPPEPTPSPATYEIRNPDFTPDPRHVPGSRQAEYDSAMTELLARLPTEEDRQRLRGMLERSTQHLPDGTVSMTRVASTSDPRTAELISTIYAIQAAEGNARALERSREMARRASLVVTIARAERLPIAGARVVVQVRVQDSPRHLILLTEDATVGDLEAGLERLTDHRREYGDQVWGDTTLAVSPSRGERSWVREADLGQRLSELRSVRPRSIAGLGVVRAIEIELGPLLPRNR